MIFHEEKERFLRAVEKAAHALERIADSPEYRWVEADKKLTRIKACIATAVHPLHGEGFPCNMCAIQKILDNP